MKYLILKYDANKMNDALDYNRNHSNITTKLVQQNTIKLVHV